MAVTLVAPPVRGAHRLGGPPTRARRVALPAGWPVVALLGLYPVWWLLGLTPFVFILAAIPMAAHLAQRRNLRLPPGFGLWALLLLWVVLSGLMLSQTAPQTLPPAGSGRYLAYVIRCLQYLSITVLMLYIGNLSERELPRRRVVRLLGVLFLVTVAGGVVGTLFPSLGFRTPTGQVLPRSLTTNAFVGRLTTVNVSQVQDVLGTGPQARPAAPFEYTNTWGQCFGLLLAWFVVGWLVKASRLRRAVAAGVLLVSLVPVVYGLNRGLWISLGLSLAYVVVRLALQGRLAPLAGVLIGVALLGGALAASPLGDVVTERLANPHSDEGRASLNGIAVDAALSSPVLGYGGTRQTVGSDKSIAIGSTPTCPQCGNRDVGSDGQLWLLLLQQGFVGASCYIGFFGYVAWRYRRDPTPIGIAGGLTVLLPLFFMLVYPAVGMPLALSLVGVALLWRNDRDRRTDLAAATAPVTAAAPAPAPATVRVGRGRPGVRRRRPGARSYVLVPSASAPRLALPAGQPRAAAAAARRAVEQTSVRGRARTALVAALFRAGAGGAVFPDRLEVQAPPGTTTLEDHLSDVLGRPVLLALRVGPPRANRKPVLQLLDTRGAPLGFAKIGVDALTRELVEAEARALATLAGTSFRALQVPELLHSGRWGGLAVLVQSTLPVWLPRAAVTGAGRRELLVAAMREVAAVGSPGPEPVDGPYSRALGRRAAAVARQPSGAQLCRALREVVEAGGTLRTGCWHGDWNEGNTATLADRVLVWDWERFACGVPVGYDALHHELQTAVTLRGRTRSDAADALVARAPGLLAPFGVPPGQAPAVTALYLVEIGTRYLADGQAEAGSPMGRVEEWMLPALARATGRLETSRLQAADEERTR